MLSTDGGQVAHVALRCWCCRLWAALSLLWSAGAIYVLSCSSSVLSGLSLYTTVLLCLPASPPLVSWPVCCCYVLVFTACIV